jgi:hypothetical protein
MFGTIRKHSTLLWVPIIILTSISMVWFFTADVSLFSSDQASEGDYGTISGRPITQPEYFEAFQEVRLAYFFQSGKWPTKDEASAGRLESETISRVFLIQKLKEMDIQVSPKSVALMEHVQLRDEPYDTFAKNFLQPNELTIADYKRYVAHQSAIQQLFSAVAVPGRLTTAAEAEALWRKENQQLAAQLAVFWTSNYLDAVAVTNGAISNFYTIQMGRYRLPERLTAGYVEFAASNYFAEADSKLAKVTNLNEIVSDYYSRGRMNTNQWTDTNGVPLPEAAAKEKIREEIRQNEALAAARRAAAAFGTQLMNQPDANKAANLETLARSNSFTFKVTKPFDNLNGGLEEFDDDAGPADRAEDSPPESARDIVRQKAFALTDDRPILFNPIVGKHAVYVIARQGKVPSEMQPLDKIQDKVTADYKTYMASQLARNAGQAFHTNLTNGLSLKKTFSDLCAAAKVKTIDLPPFSASTRGLTNIDSRINLRFLQGLAQDTEIGQASAFLPAQPASEGGFILFAKARPPVDEAKLKTELPEFINQMRVYRQNEAFQQWFRKQVEQAKVAGPKRETTIGAQN